MPSERNHKLTMHLRISTSPSQFQLVMSTTALMATISSKFYEYSVSVFKYNPAASTILVTPRAK